jgi:hypothetical protein
MHVHYKNRYAFFFQNNLFHFIYTKWATKEKKNYCEFIVLQKTHFAQLKLKCKKQGNLLFVPGIAWTKH